MTPSSTPIEIIVADDHPLFLESLQRMVKEIPGFKLIGAAANGKELIALAKKLKPDIIITDIKMPIIDGIEATKQILKELPGVGIIALSMTNEQIYIADILEAGAKGYLLKSAHITEIVTAVKAVYNNEPYYSPEIKAAMIKMVAKGDYQDYLQNIKQRFSEKERAIIKLICQEYSNKQIADKLGMTKRAVDGLRDNILKKTDAKNAAGIVVYAMRNNLYK